MSLFLLPSNLFASEALTPNVIPTDSFERNLMLEQELPSTTLVYKDGEHVATIQGDAETVKESLEAPARSLQRVEEESSENPQVKNFYDRGLTNESQKAIGTGTDYVELKSGLVVTETTSPYLVIKINSIIGTPPTSIEAVNALYRGTERFASLGLFTQLNAVWSAGQIWVGQAVTKPITVNKTYFYSTYNSTFGIWVVNPQTGQLGTAGDSYWEVDILLNRLGQRYPSWKNVDVHGYLNSTMPSSTEWPTYSSSYTAPLRETFNNSVRTAYRNYYDSNYGYVNWTQPIEIHHIRPLEYGGNNDFSNLIPLWADHHLKFSFWFSYYK